MQDLEVRRRYSDFYSLRNALVQLHPTLIIPPIPEKHTMADYAAKPTKAKEDEAIIDYRKRMLTSFLNRCRKMKHVREDTVFTRFLDPNASWVRGSNTFQPHYLMSCDTNICRARYCTHLPSHLCPRTTSKLLRLILPIPPRDISSS